jgi:hypothetical protein
MLKPNDLPLICLPVDLSDEAAAKLIEYLREFTDALESHYYAQLRRYYQPTYHAAPDLHVSDSTDPTDPPF